MGSGIINGEKTPREDAEDMGHRVVEEVSNNLKTSESCECSCDITL